MENGEIKFRAWYSSVKKMRHFANGMIIADGPDRYGMFFPLTEGSVFLSKCEVMQFTGLKDSKRTEEYPEGQEVYAGDIVKAWKHNETPFTHEIKHRNGIFWFGNWNWSEFQNIFRNIEVIGNRWGNPELTEVAQ